MDCLYNVENHCVLLVICRLPFVEAVLLEVQRMYAVVPVSGPRSVACDTLLSDFIIPKVRLWKSKQLKYSCLFVEYNCAF